MSAGGVFPQGGLGTLPRLVALLCCLCLAGAGCVRHNVAAGPDTPDAPADIVLLASAHAPLPVHDRAQPSVYILLRDQTGKAQGLQQRIAHRLTERGYTVAGQPSQVGHIVQCNVVFAGDMPTGAAARSTPHGYGGTVGGAGVGESVLMADVIVASRVVPEPVRRKHGNSLTFGTKNTKLDDMHVRLAACAPASRAAFARFQPALEKRLADAIADLLPKLR